jgi:hypothetical protein
VQRRIKLAIRTLKTGNSMNLSRQEIPAITLEEVAEAKTFFPMDKFFIFGHARSGTTVLARLIRLHPEVHCNYQAHFFSRPPLLQALVADDEVANWLRRKSNRWNRGGDLSAPVLRAAADFIMERDARREDKHIVGDKSPNSLLNGDAVQLMHQVYPDAKLIYIVRDGRDTVISHRFQAFIDLPRHLSREDQRIRSEFAKDPEPFLHGERSIFTERGIRHAAEGWVKNITETHQLGGDLYQDHYISLRYEDLIPHPWDEMCRVWSFLNADTTHPGLDGAIAGEMQQNPDAEWQQEKAGDIAKSIRKGKQGSWRNIFTPRDREIFQEIAVETLIKWGYDNHDSLDS